VLKGPIEERVGVALQLLENSGSPAIACGGVGAGVSAGIGAGEGGGFDEVGGGTLVSDVLEPPPPQAPSSAAVAKSPANFDRLMQLSMPTPLLGRIHRLPG